MPVGALAWEERGLSSAVQSAFASEWEPGGQAVLGRMPVLRGPYPPVSPALHPLPSPHREQRYHGAARRVSLSRDVYQPPGPPPHLTGDVSPGVDPNPLRVGPELLGTASRCGGWCERLRGPLTECLSHPSSGLGPVQQETEGQCVRSERRPGPLNDSVRLGRDRTAPISGSFQRTTSTLSTLSEAWGPRCSVLEPWRVLLCAGHSSIIFLEGSTAPLSLE